MKTTFDRSPATVREPRVQPTSRAPVSARAPRTEWAWPGLTRAELRAHVIDQIG